MTDHIHIGFEARIVILPLDTLMPRRKVEEAHTRTVKYKRILSSIAEVGIVEPLVVAKMAKKSSNYLLLDGHLRHFALQALAHTEVKCLIADDDEGFTYNKRINGLATIQEHFMIMRALKSGVPEEKLAKALDVDIKHIERRRALLDGICPEVVEMLKDKSVNPVTFDVLRKLRPMRQIEAVELMASAANWTSSYAKALLAATRQEDLAKPDRPKKIAGMTREQMARMEHEMESLHSDFKQIEDSYGDDVLNLVLASGYLAKLVSNPEIERYLTNHHDEFLAEFKVIVSASSLDAGGAAI